MAKAKKTAFFCQNCGYESAKWMGQCPACREWNTFVEEPTAAKTPAGNQGLGSHSAAGRKPVHLTEISTGKEERIPTGIGELDRVLGGGIVPGSLTLVGGDPGIGKSTLLLQVCRMLSTAGHQVLYISGEESLRQIKLRAVRIGEFNENLSLLCETNLDIIRAVMEKEKPEIAVIDSIQTMYNEEVSSAPGSVSQVRESTNVLMQIAKGMGNFDLYRRPCDKKTVMWPAHVCWNTCRYRAVLRGRPSCVLPDSTRRQKPFWFYK